MKNMINRSLAAIISFIIPGVGEIIQGDSYKGGLMFLIAVIIWCLGYFMGPWGPYFWALSFVYALVAAYDTYNINRYY